MTVQEAVQKMQEAERNGDLQPEGRWVAAAYENRELDMETCLYLVAYLLKRVNAAEVRR